MKKQNKTNSNPTTPANWQEVWREYGKLTSDEERAGLLARYAVERVFPRFWDALMDWLVEINKVPPCVRKLDPLYGTEGVFDLVALAFSDADIGIAPGVIRGTICPFSKCGLSMDEQSALLGNAIREALKGERFWKIAH